MTLPEPVAAAPLAANARCATCAAALAPDQMFCLSCGTRRRDARIAFRDVLATEAAPVVTPIGGGAGGWPPGAAQEGAYGPMGPGRITYVPFIATLALLLFALGIGVWIGREPATAAAPVAGLPYQSVAATTPATTPTDAAAASDDEAADEDDAAAEDAKDDEPTAPVKDDTGALQTLEKLSPEEYQKQSQKLPDEVGTGGTPPPKDDKPAAGGEEFESFE